MKIKLLLGVLLASSITAFSQKKLISNTNKSYNEGGSINFIDSTHYSYSNWQGGIFENEPKFTSTFDNPVYQFGYEIPEINYSSADVYANNMYPLNFNNTRGRAYNSNFKVVTDSTSYDKSLFTYNATNGKIEMIENQYFDGFNWITNAIDSYVYDASNRPIEYRRQIDMGSGLVVVEIDSLFYVGSTMNINKAVNYSSNDGVSFTQEIMTQTTFSGNNPTQLDFYVTGTFTYRGNYVYTLGQVDSLKVFPVVLGVPQSTMIGSFVYDYNAANKLFKETTTGFEETITTYTYDTDNFLTQIQREELDSNGVAFFVSNLRNFTYQNVASIEENSVEVSLYPNPVQSTLTVKTAEEIESILIYDMKGNLVVKQAKLATVDVSKLMVGTYKIIAITQSGQAETSFIKN
jgi:hypothetical protein